MQFLYLAFCFVICTVFAAEAPYEYKGNPQRAYLILPPQVEVQNETTTKSVQNETESAVNATDSELARFKQLQGSVINVYYISLPDGKTEKLEYLRAPSGQQYTQEAQPQYPKSTNYQSTYNQYRQSSAGQSNPSNPEGNQVVRGTNKFENQQPYNAYLAPQQFPSSNQKQQQYNADTSQKDPSNYVATVHYTDVPPVHGPVFAYSVSL